MRDKLIGGRPEFEDAANNLIAEKVEIKGTRQHEFLLAIGARITAEGVDPVRYVQIASEEAGALLGRVYAENPAVAQLLLISFAIAHAGVAFGREYGQAALLAKHEQEWRAGMVQDRPTIVH